MDDVVERVARAICEADKPSFEKEPRWDHLGLMLQAQFKGLAKAAIRAVLEGLERDLALTELANVEGASSDWLDGFRAAVARLSAIKEAVK